MNNMFRDPIGRKRRLITIRREADWRSLINYYGEYNPYPGFEPENYPGELIWPDERYYAMIQEAITYLGNSYLWGGKYPPNFDCSGFVGYLYKTHEIIPHSIVSFTGTLYDYVVDYPISEDERQPGDWLFWRGTGGQGAWDSNAHVAIYIGNGYIIDSSGRGVDYRLVTYHPIDRFLGYFRCPEYP